MPIRPENADRYPDDWSEISDRIRFARAGGRCECIGECGLHRGRRCTELHGKPAIYARGKVVLTTAHLDHVPENVDDDNLRAMCQRCHLRYDRHHHKVSRLEEQGQRRLELVDA